MAQLELLRNRLITAHIRILQVIQQPTSLTDHHQQPASRTVIFLVLLQMFGQVIDPLREQRDLDVRRASILLMQLKIAYRL